MQFGELPLNQAEGAILAHMVRGKARKFKKGHRLTGVDLADLREAGVSHVLGALLDENDAAEDEAAAAIAAALAGTGIRVAPAFTGRANLFAELDGVVRFDEPALHALNRLDERITVATLRPLEAVRSGQMIATVKIIPFAVPKFQVAAAVDLAAQATIEVSGFRQNDVALIQTRLASTPEKVLQKTARVTGERLGAYRARLVADTRCAHTIEALVAEIDTAVRAGADMLLITGASAITDRDDILPSAIRQAGGDIDYFGMPVDPGNLLLLAHIGDLPVIGMPGCARSPKLNGFDWVLQRLAAGIDVGAVDIQAMGVGGLLSEIPSRPQPRHGKVDAPPKIKFAGLVLAAGQSRRMGAKNKLLIEIDGRPMVRHAIDALSDAGLEPIVTVVGHQSEAVRSALSDYAIEFVYNPDFAQGLATSLRVGIERLRDRADAVVVALGDMPLVDAGLIERLVSAFDPATNRGIVVPTFRGKRGNPVLWSSRYFDEMVKIEGDVGAKHLIGMFADDVFELPCEDRASLIDLDTPQALAEFEQTP